VERHGADAATAIERSRRSIHAIREVDGGLNLVQPIVTPRFVPACTDELLRGLAALAQEENVRVQSHCSESDWEHGHVIDRYGKHDTAVLTEIGLIKPHTILAHGNHMIDSVTGFWLATAGGADALGIAAGRLAVGYAFDAFVVDLNRPRSPLRVWPGIDDEARVFEKIVRLAGPSDISSVWVNGRLVQPS
jgi:cytosine/adenosine deaminase-related metal-dependent hydrolase